MNLEEFATDLVAENDFIKASFGGFAGSGKTRTSCEFIKGCYKLMKLEKPILIIDNEKGSRFLVPFFKDAGIKVLLKETVNLADVLKAFEFLKNGDIDFLFIDSLTKVWYKYVADYKSKNSSNRNPKRFMTLQDWGKILPSWQEQFADKFVGVEGNCVFTGRGGYTYDMEKNEQGKYEAHKSGVKMKMAGETPFEPDLNIWMEQNQSISQEGKVNIWREALIMKDRSGLIDGKTFKNPVFDDFKPVVEYLVAVDKGEVKKSSDEDNLAPSEDYSNYGEKKQAEIDKIKGLFDLIGFGTSKEDKEMKANIINHVFGTVSIGEIEMKGLDELVNCTMKLNRVIHCLVEEKDSGIKLNLQVVKKYIKE